MAHDFAVGYPLPLESVTADRKSGRLPDAQFVDSHFLDLMNDPGGCIRRIYEQLGRPFTETFAADVLRYLQNKPKDKFGRHKYRVEDMGVDVGELDARCRNYMQHFGVRREQ